MQDVKGAVVFFGSTEDAREGAWDAISVEEAGTPTQCGIRTSANIKKKNLQSHSEYRPGKW